MLKDNLEHLSLWKKNDYGQIKPLAMNTNISLKILSPHHSDSRMIVDSPTKFSTKNSNLKKDLKNMIASLDHNRDKDKSLLPSINSSHAFTH